MSSIPEMDLRSQRARQSGPTGPVNGVRAPSKRIWLLRRWTLISGFVVAMTCAAIWFLRTGPEAPVLPGAQVEGLTAVLARSPPAQPTPIRFEDVTDAVGVDFRHFPFERSSLLPEDMGSGVAVGDFDNDGYPDLFFVNFSGPALPGAAMDLCAGRSRLFRNAGGNDIADVTDAAGVGFVGYGMGACWGDFDNDGYLDLYVTAYGNNVLYRNRGDGTFEDVTEAAGVNDPRFSAGCRWADYNRNGYLDLYVTNYVGFEFREQDRGRTELQYATEQPFTLNPSAYPPVPNSLFRNNGDGTFTEVGAAAGVADPLGRSLSATWADLDNDGRLDLYVANDISNNSLFRNRGDGTFEDISSGSLAADYRGAMGIACADFDNDLDLDIFISNWLAQENTLFRNMLYDPLLGRRAQDPGHVFPPDNPRGLTPDAARKGQASAARRLWFMDAADEYGLGQISLDAVGWASGFADFDNDGRPDLWVVNGNTLQSEADAKRLIGQPAFVFWNQGKKGFADVTARASSKLAEPRVSRGGAQLDFDRDGRIDLVVQVHGGEAFVLRNVSQPVGRRLGVSLRQRGGNTHTVGGRVYVTAAGATRMAEVGPGSSYLSQNELPLHFGLGEARHVDELRIVWPDGCQETHQDLAVDQQLDFRHDAHYAVRASAERASRQ